MLGKKKWSDLSSSQRAGVVVALIVQTALAIWVQRDLSRRPEEGVRGPKLLWRLASLNTSGVVAYVLFGRRRSAVPVDVS